MERMPRRAPFVLWTFPPLAGETLDVRSLQDVGGLDAADVEASFVE